MLVNIQGRKVEVTPALKSYALEKVSVLNKYLEGNVKVHFTLSVDKKHQQTVEVTVSANQTHLKSVESNDDMYASIDKAMDKIARQAKKQKEKAKDHHAKDSEDVSAQREIVKEKVDSAPSFTDDEAVTELSETGELALVYKCSTNDTMKVAYYRSDGNIGITEA